MKKSAVLFSIVLMGVACLFACKSAPPVVENLNVGPELTVTIPELFTPNPEDANESITIGIEVNHSVPIKDWSIAIQPRRQGSQTGGQTNRQQNRQRQTEQTGDRQRQDGASRQRRAFFEQKGENNPPAQWRWNGRGTSGEMVQSAMDYSFELTVSDVFDNSTTYEGVISIGIIVIRDGDKYRMAVPSIIFPPNSADFRQLSEEERRSNTRVLTLVARVLGRFEDYKVTVEGHANPTTPPDTAARKTEEDGARNVIGLKPLSEQRAKAVMDHLITNNEISSSQLTAVGAGGTRTVAEWDDDEENWKNRRVEFILEK